MSRRCVHFATTQAQSDCSDQKRLTARVRDVARVCSCREDRRQQHVVAEAVYGDSECADDRKVATLNVIVARNGTLNVAREQGCIGDGRRPDIAKCNVEERGRERLLRRLLERDVRCRHSESRRRPSVRSSGHRARSRKARAARQNALHGLKVDVQLIVSDRRDQLVGLRAHSGLML
eukprot:5342071-Prymnesium_polylepis.1